MEREKEKEEETIQGEGEQGGLSFFWFLLISFVAVRESKRASFATVHPWAPNTDPTGW